MYMSTYMHIYMTQMYVHVYINILFAYLSLCVGTLEISHSCFEFFISSPNGSKLRFCFLHA